MTQQNPNFNTAEHDWHSTEYVDDWIARDVTRAERPPTLAEMLAVAPFKKDAAIRVLDVGGGNGQVTEALLKAFPNAKVTLQDYSQVMLDKAAERFAKYGDQVKYVLSDLYDKDWTKSAGGPFDLVVSGIAIHNLRELEPISAVYAGIKDLLVPGGAFLNCDHYAGVGGIALHVDEMKKIGYSKVEAVKDAKPGITAAFK
ncbi:MAG TPA: class I SAM-dependent methyltransferase [Candidatus Lustribacter sp.]|jgi:ubiquinone/menaquinone biosynthesis C-methylase UbiE|nr:class I SAM-dependent methyltransferase [Candidatus Lustribacter sp.]